MTSTAADKSKIFVVAGPTASGKTSYAINLAEKHDGVIINADSMQIYDALPILSAQPSADEQSQAPHFLYGALKPAETCSAEKWRNMASAIIQKALSENKVPILVGGTGLYLKAMMEGFSPIPDVPQNIREKISAQQKALGNPAFHEMLSRVDPEMAHKLHPNDTQRLIRAAEVLQATGLSLSHWQSLPLSGPPDETWAFEIHMIEIDRDTLYRRCNQRFDLMLESGALAEAEAFHAKIVSGAVPSDAPVTHALGFHPLQDYFEGKISLEEAVSNAKAQTRQYAKRQLTWFKHQIKTDKLISL